MCKCRQSRDTREDCETYIWVRFCKDRENIGVVYPNRIVPIIRTESIFYINDVWICSEIIIKNLASSIDYRKKSIGDIYPCLGPSRICHFTWNKKYIFSVYMHFSIRHHCIVIWEYDNSWSFFCIGFDKARGDDGVLNYMDTIIRFLGFCSD